ncbi:hypothetical protein DXT99_23070 [Pontibacter diazotrophicus]|uniref:Uncharacterized protein n=1 Tax=Pontibacter diazotrophicus TaxID=1400979 RepID=A0A3D8L3L1_9BACT|nr:hypothetical protein DXT99_23070 [Pontibacter diazotrophicus]
MAICCGVNVFLFINNCSKLKVLLYFKTVLFAGELTGVLKAPDLKTVYSYDSTGFLAKEILYHDGKGVVQIVNIKEYEN